MKKYFLFLSTIFVSFCAVAQVGIGTTSPSEALDVETSNATKTAVDINNTGGGDPKINFQLGGTTTFSIGVDNSDADKFKIGTTEPETNTAITIDGSQKVGVGTTTPHASAKLEVSSTTQGFLPPRMTQDQRNAIASPAAGLIIWCTNCGAAGELQTYNGAAWSILAPAGVSSGSGSHYLGEEYLDGIVFYIYIGGDGQQHGLVVSKTESTGTWSGSSLVGANKTSDGAYNTNLMPADSPAKTWVTGLGAGWYLPSIDELSLLWHNRFHVNNSSASGLALLKTTSYYWSSTENAASNAWTFYFNYGSAITYNKKDGAGYVRAVRAF